MLKKIVSLKNIGRFINSAAPGNGQLRKFSFITGANGYGKTTICSVLRSVQTGDVSHIVGRKTLGAAGDQQAELLLDSGMFRFDGTAWTGQAPRLAVFDGVFIAENVYSGEAVEIDHKRNLYRIIVGDEGVRLAKQDADLAAQSRAKTSEITAAGKAIVTHFQGGLKLPEILALENYPDVTEQITAKEQHLEAVKQAESIAKRPLLQELVLPKLPDDLIRLLGTTLEGLSKEAEDLVEAHLAHHGMVAGGSNWVAQALPHAKETCPFCGQGIAGVPLIAAYREVFSERYREFQTQITEAGKAVRSLFGERAAGQWQLLLERNAAGVEFWGQYCALDKVAVAVPQEALRATTDLGDAVLDLVERKIRTPLEAIEVDERFTKALSAFDVAGLLVASVNESIRLANAILTEKKATTSMGSVAQVSADLLLLKASKKRHSEPVLTMGSEYGDLVKAKEVLDAEREGVRKALDVHTEAVVRPYERRINDYLDAFNAGFAIAETTHNYAGGVATSSYQLVINKTGIDVGDGKTPASRPSFRNTLSAGDRATLALAVFLAHLERDPEIANTIVVFDDPFNSQDAFRRRQTVHEILKIGARCRQVIVLSHDATFLKQIWEKVPAAERAALAIADHRAQGSKLLETDLERATAGRTASDIDDLQAYLATGAGTLVDIIRKMRVVLETHCRTTYPASFDAGDWLGDMVGKIRVGGDTHPAASLYDELDQINEYTKQYHHGEDMSDTTPDQIDPRELTGFTRRTLRLVNALQA